LGTDPSGPVPVVVVPEPPPRPQSLPLPLSRPEWRTDQQLRTIFHVRACTITALIY